jgi:hypothetical protein
MLSVDKSIEFQLSHEIVLFDGNVQWKLIKTITVDSVYLILSNCRRGRDLVLILFTST